jgi:hypothetical protein
VRLDQEYPSAAHLFSAYLHQDWPEDAGSWQAAIDHYVGGEALSLRVAAQRELARLLAETRDERALATALEALGNFYHPGAEGLTYRAWLAQVLARLAATG